MVDEKQIQNDFDAELDNALDNGLVIDGATETEVEYKQRMNEATQQLKQSLTQEDDMVDVELEELSDEVSGVVQLEEGDVGKPFTIKNAFIKKPIFRNADGTLIEPKASRTNEKRKYYVSKLIIEYDTGKRYTSIVPNVKWYVKTENGKMSLSPWFATNIKEDDLEDQFVPVISKLYYKYCVAYKQEVGSVSMKDFIANLSGKTVILKQHKQKNPDTGKIGYRIDITEFVTQ